MQVVYRSAEGTVLGGITGTFHSRRMQCRGKCSDIVMCFNVSVTVVHKLSLSQIYGHSFKSPIDSLYIDDRLLCAKYCYRKCSKAINLAYRSWYIVVVQYLSYDILVRPFHTMIR